MTSLGHANERADGRPRLAIGLMSGTSSDGVDAALLRTDGQSHIEFIESVTVPYEPEMRGTLIEAASHDIPLAALLRLERAITDVHVEACKALLQKAAHNMASQHVTVSGFHGHTLRHLGHDRLTWQIGDASWLAERLSIPVVSDFRRRDVAAGGHGAPLAPLFHQQLLAEVPKPSMMLNLGGIANITWVGQRGEVLAGDVGPGCGLLDILAMRATGEPCDRDGRLAKEGRVHPGIVETAMAHPFFARPLPKSADRFDFDFIDVGELTAADGAATLCAVTAEAVHQCVECLGARPRSVWVTGGGVHHPGLMEMLGQRLANVQSVERLGQRPDSLEAECFAWLAVRRLRGLPTTSPDTTGCRRPTCGGILTC